VIEWIHPITSVGKRDKSTDLWHTAGGQMADFVSEFDRLSFGTLRDP
jgi:hypothetical protein